MPLVYYMKYRVLMECWFDYVSGLMQWCGRNWQDQHKEADTESGGGHISLVWCLIRCKIRILCVWCFFSFAIFLCNFIGLKFAPFVITCIKVMIVLNYGYVNILALVFLNSLSAKRANLLLLQNIGFQCILNWMQKCDILYKKWSICIRLSLYF